MAKIERVQLRRGTTSQWAASNTVLSQGELAIELSDATQQPVAIKIGDGQTAWSALGYIGGLSTEQVDDRVAALLVGGTGVTLTYDDAGNTLTVAVLQEQVEDWVGSLLQDSSVIDVTYNDAGGVESFTILAGSVTNAMLANMAQSTIKGRTAGAGTGVPVDLTVAQVKTILALASTDLSDFTEATQDVVGAFLVGSGLVVVTYNDAGNVDTVSLGNTTKRIPLLLNAAETPDGTGAGNNAPQPKKIVSTGAQTANAPKATETVWAFDGATDEHLMFRFILPADYVSGGTLRGKFENSSTTAGNVIWKGAVAQMTDGTTDFDSGASVFDAVTTSGAVAAPTVVGVKTEFTIALTGGYTAGREVTVMIGRDADAAADTLNAIDAYLSSLTFEYTGSL